MTPRLIVSDLDGTLLGSDHRLHDSTIEVLQELVRQGHHLALASGRHYHDMRVFRDELGVPAHLISTNGAYTHDPDDGLILKMIGSNVNILFFSPVLFEMCYGIYLNSQQ